jgi:hypothetical protein
MNFREIVRVYIIFERMLGCELQSTQIFEEPLLDLVEE